MVKIMDETVRSCLYYGYTLTVINWLQNDIKISTKKEAIIILNKIMHGFVKEFNSDNYYTQTKKAENHKLNKSISIITKHFEDIEIERKNKKKEKIEEISENFIKVNIN